MSTKFYKITYTGIRNNHTRVCTEHIKTKDIRSDLKNWVPIVEFDHGEHIVSIEEIGEYSDLVTLTVQTQATKRSIK